MSLFGVLPSVARKLRIPYAGAIYHVMNRGDRCEACHPGAASGEFQAHNHNLNLNPNLFLDKGLD